jgi:hypothetical protein
MGYMLKQMWTALTAVFTMIEYFGHAGTKVAKAADALGGWCEDTAGSFADRAKQERAQAMSALQATTTRSLTTNALPAPTTTTTQP